MSNPAIEAMKIVAGSCLTLVAAPILLLVAIFASMRNRPVQVGFGPQPLLNHVYSVQALRRLGFTAESYCIRPYHITRNFDHILIEDPPGFLACLPPRILWVRLCGFAWSIRRFQVLAISCHGGLLGDIPVLRCLEPMLIRLAGVRTIIMPYGSDVNTYGPRNPNPRYRRALEIEYPGLKGSGPRTRAHRWSRHADVVINGCDWIDYLDRRDVLTLGHFAIDTNDWQANTPWSAPASFNKTRPLRVLHAPNHPAVKGTAALRNAVEQLSKEGLPVTLEVIQNRPNEEVREAILNADLVVDQLVIGWYAMFALEAMASSRAVACHIREDLEQVYIEAGIIEAGELPHLRADEETIEDLLRSVLAEPKLLKKAASRGRPFVQDHHSLEWLGGVMTDVLADLRIHPAGTPANA